MRRGACFLTQTSSAVHLAGSIYLSIYLSHSVFDIKLQTYLFTYFLYWRMEEQSRLSSLWLTEHLRTKCQIIGRCSRSSQDTPLSRTLSLDTVHRYHYVNFKKNFLTTSLTL